MNDLLMRPIRAPKGVLATPSQGLVDRDGQRITADDKLNMMAIVNRFDWTLLSAKEDELMALMTDDIEFDHGFGYGKGKKDALEVIKKVPSMGLLHHFTNHTNFIDDDGYPAVATYCS